MKVFSQQLGSGATQSVCMPASCRYHHYVHVLHALGDNDAPATDENVLNYVYILTTVLQQLLVYLVLSFLLLLSLSIYLLTPDEHSLSKVLVLNCSLC